MISDTVFLERFMNEGGMDLFDEEDAIGLLLDMARCPGDRQWLSYLLLREFGSLKAVLEAREEQLMHVDGIGKRTATLIRMITGFIRMWNRVGMEKADRIGSSTEAEQFCKSLLVGFRNERFFAICLNSRCEVLGTRMISEGSLSEVNAYPRVVMEVALNYNAHSILLCHNHPGGTLKPSPEDIASTKSLQQLLKGIGILLLDHIIVAGNDAYSMIQHGDIDYRK